MYENTNVQYQALHKNKNNNDDGKKTNDNNKNSYSDTNTNDNDRYSHLSQPSTTAFHHSLHSHSLGTAFRDGESARRPATTFVDAVTR